MYNEELKQKFMDDYTTSESMKQLCKTVFNKVAKYEEAWSADVCSISDNRLHDMIRDIIGFRSRSKWSSIVVLRSYVKWCIRNGVPYACDSMLHSDIIKTVSNKIKTRMVSLPVSLQSYLDSVCSPENMQATDNIYRCFYWLAYMGMPEDDIINVRASEIDFDNLTVKSNGKTYDMYKESLPAFKNCAKLTSFYFNNPRYTETQVWKQRVSGDQLLRGIRGMCTIKSMRTALVKNTYDYTKNPPKKKTDIQLSYHRAWLSGVFYRMYEKEKSGREVDFEPIVLNFLQKREYDFSHSNNKNLNIKKRELIKDYLEDYQQWKLAFFL